MIQWWSFFWKVLIGVIQSFAIYCQVPSGITCCQFFVIGQISGYEIQFLGINCKSSLDHKDENANEIRAVSKIKAGEEITLTYNWKQLAMKDWKTRQDNLWYNWGFRQAYSSFNNFFMTIILWGNIPSLLHIQDSIAQRQSDFSFAYFNWGCQYYSFHQALEKREKVFKGGNHLMKENNFWTISFVEIQQSVISIKG